MEAAQICCSLEIDTMFRSSNTLRQSLVWVKNMIIPEKEGCDWWNYMQWLWTCVYRWNSISPSWTTLISICIFLTQLTNLRLLPPFPLYFYYTVSSSFSPNYIPFLELLLVSTEEDLWSEFLDQKLLPFTTIYFKWYSYGIKICSNEPLQFQLSSTFTMHLPKHIRWEYLGVLSSI